MCNLSEARDRLRKFRKRRRDDLLYVLALFAVHLFRFLPLSLGVRIGGMLGGVAYFLLPRERNRALDHTSRLKGFLRFRSARAREQILILLILFTRLDMMHQVGLQILCWLKHCQN